MTQDLQSNTAQWETLVDYDDILFEKQGAIAKITINRPHVRNAFRPKTVKEMIDAVNCVKTHQDIGVLILTGYGDKAFCSGGDQSVRKESGYADEDGTESLNVLELQKMLKSLPIVVVAMVNGYAIGGGHVLHLVCDLTIASENAIFGQVGPKVGSFDGGFGASLLVSTVGVKKAKEIWFLCQQYTAFEAEEMGLVNKVVPFDILEKETLKMCHTILKHSPLAIRLLKSSFNAALDGQAGLQELAGNATLLYYMTQEAQEGKNAFLEKRKPNFEQFPWRK